VSPILPGVPTLDHIREALAAHEPARVREGDISRAAVSVVLREEDSAPEILFIERAAHADDPWSGHMAFPGGRVDPTDAGPRGAAERETLEEVGVDLARAERLGRLDDLTSPWRAEAPTLVISAFVYFAPDPEPLRPNYEVREAFWVPLRALLHPERRVAYESRRAGSLRYPGLLVGEPERHVVWGLTYRFLEVLFHAIGHPLPNRWGEIRPAADAS